MTNSRVGRQLPNEYVTQSLIIMEVNGWTQEVENLKSALSIAIHSNQSVTTIVEEINLHLEDMDEHQIQKGLIFYPID